jgi:predicted nucleic acid-binding protein
MLHPSTPCAVIAVSNASPLITLARIDYLDSLGFLYGSVPITPEVSREVVISGAGLPGATAVARAPWINVVPLNDEEAVVEYVRSSGLGIGEVSTILLAKQIDANLALIDEWCSPQRH